MVVRADDELSGRATHYLNPAESVEELRKGIDTNTNLGIAFIYGLSCVNLPKMLSYFSIIL